MSLNQKQLDPKELRKMPLRPDEKEEIEWAAIQLERLAPAAAVTSMSSATSKLIKAIKRHVDAAFPLTPDEERIREKNAAETNKRMAENGPKMWKELHEFAASFNGEIEIGQRWWVRFLLRVETQLCQKCAQHARQYERAHPIDWTNLFRWTWEFHNWVLANQGKDEFPYDEAAALYLPK